jgi:hypothetical protein
MTALQEILAFFKKAPSGETNGKGMPAQAELPRSDEARNAWQRLIDEKLIEWGRHPEQFEDDGYKAPTADNLVRATGLVVYCRDKGVIPPLRMASDGEGGILFDWKNSSLPYHAVAQIHADGSMEMLVFHDCNLVARERIGAEALHI